MELTSVQMARHNAHALSPPTQVQVVQLR